jgi:hypothetical protein
MLSGDSPVGPFGMKPGEFKTDQTAPSPKSHDRISFQCHFAEDFTVAGCKPAFRDRDETTEHRPARSFGGDDAQLVVALVEDQLIVFFANAETGVEKGGAKCTHR